MLDSYLRFSREGIRLVPSINSTIYYSSKAETFYYESVTAVSSCLSNTLNQDISLLIEFFIYKLNGLKPNDSCFRLLSEVYFDTFDSDLCIVIFNLYDQKITIIEALDSLLSLNLERTQGSMKAHVQTSDSEQFLQSQKLNSPIVELSSAQGFMSLLNLPFLLFIGILVLAIVIQSIAPRSKTDEFMTKPKLPSNINSIRLKKLESRFQSVQTTYDNARLVCELESASKTVSSIMADANLIGAKNLSSRSKLLSSNISARLKQVDPKVGQFAYSENCNRGIGAQFYDSSSTDSEFGLVHKIFLVAKRNCLSPAVKIIISKESDLKNHFHSQWVSFNPDSHTGINDNIYLRVPASKLPSGKFWYGITDYKCN